MGVKRSMVSDGSWPTASIDSRRTGVPVVLGLGALVVALFASQWLVIPVALMASVVAGGVLPESPIRAGVFFFVPTAIVLLLAGFLIREVRPTIFVFPLTGGLMMSLVASHIGAGIARRRRIRLSD